MSEPVQKPGSPLPPGQHEAWEEGFDRLLAVSQRRIAQLEECLRFTRDVGFNAAKITRVLEGRQQLETDCAGLRLRIADLEAENEKLKQIQWDNSERIAQLEQLNKASPGE